MRKTQRVLLGVGALVGFGTVVVVVEVEVNQQFITDDSTASPSCVLESCFVSHRFVNH